MPADAAQVEWIVKTALLDESISTDSLVALMKKNNITSVHLMNYINDDGFWPVNTPDSTFKVPEKDEKYILNFSSPADRQSNRMKRDRARAAVERRFYTGHKFNEWLI